MKENTKTTVVVTRRTVIKALRTEKLRANNFFHTDNTLSKCAVCAVGAVLRSSLTQEQLRDADGYNATRGVYSGCDTEKEVQEKTRCEINEGNYLGALSVYFESLARRFARKGRGERANLEQVEAVNWTSRRREKLVDFVKKNFPKTIEITV